MPLLFSRSDNVRFFVAKILISFVAKRKEKFDQCIRLYSILVPKKIALWV